MSNYGYYLQDNKKITNKNRIIDDHSNWGTSSRVADYLNRLDKIPHRAEGELLLCDFIPKKTRRILDLGTGNGRLIKLLKEKNTNCKICSNRFFSSYA